MYIFANNQYEKHIVVWLRYIDDVFLIWRGEEQVLKEFFTWIDSRDANLSFESSYNIYQIHFLDLMVKKCYSHLSILRIKNPRTGTLS